MQKYVHRKITKTEIHEVTYLVDGTGDKTRDVLAASKYLWKGTAKGGSRLNRRETDLPDTVRATKAEDALDLVEGHAFLDAQHCPIEGWLAAENGMRIVRVVGIKKRSANLILIKISISHNLNYA